LFSAKAAQGDRALFRFPTANDKHYRRFRQTMLPDFKIDLFVTDIQVRANSGRL